MRSDLTIRAALNRSEDDNHLAFDSLQTLSLKRRNSSGGARP